MVDHLAHFSVCIFLVENMLFIFLLFEAEKDLFGGEVYRYNKFVVIGKSLGNTLAYFMLQPPVKKANCGETWRATAKCGEPWGNAVNCGELWQKAVIHGKLRRNPANCGETQESAANAIEIAENHLLYENE